jgi:hypothetical protein
LKELCCTSGGDCAGTSVDNAFFQIFVKLVGSPLLITMKKGNPSAYLDIFREFEDIKRTVYTNKDDKVTMSIPRLSLIIFVRNITRKILQQLFSLRFTTIR